MLDAKKIVRRVRQSKCNKQNNQIVLYQRKYKAYIQEVRLADSGAWLEQKWKTIREQ